VTNILNTTRLLLVPYTEDFAEDLARISDPKISVERALQGIKDLQQQEKDGKRIAFAVIYKPEDLLAGTTDLTIDPENKHIAELGNWFGEDYRYCGYCVEASKAVFDYAFSELDIHTIYAETFIENKPSIKAMQKLNMTHTETRMSKDGDKIETIVRYDITNQNNYPFIL
jgi:RimJ/RimL family protein N-acetyltransferase